MNELVDKFGSEDFTILAFPCNQFYRQSQDTDLETLSLLKHVRPGNGYVPKFEHSTKIDVNGANAPPIFKWLRESLPTPVDDAGKVIMRDHTCIAWDPVEHNDMCVAQLAPPPRASVGFAGACRDASRAVGSL